MKTKGIILAGGLSKRFGRNKALEPLEHIGTKPLIQHTRDLLKRLGLEVTIISRHRGDYTFLNCTIVEDIVKDLGPLGGLWTAMKTYPSCSLLTLTCDMPMLPIESLKTLINSHDLLRQATCYKSNHTKGACEPFPGIYEASLIDEVEHCIKIERLSMSGIISDIPQKKVLPWTWSKDLLNNINCQSDLQAMRNAG